MTRLAFLLVVTAISSMATGCVQAQSFLPRTHTRSVSPDGQHVAEVRQGFNVDPPDDHLYLISRGRPERRLMDLPPDVDWSTAVAWAADSRKVGFVISDRALVVFDVATGEREAYFPLVGEGTCCGGSEEARNVTFSADATEVSFDRIARALLRIDNRDGRTIEIFESPGYPVRRRRSTPPLRPERNLGRETVRIPYSGQDSAGPVELRSDPPIACPLCDAWNAARQPFKVFGNTYYVGTAGLSSVLIASDAGLILLDAALPQSAPQIGRHIRSLGFRVEDVRLILNSHAHFDHAGGIGALQRASGATVVASEAGARALERGEPGPDDPQYALRPQEKAFPPVARVRAVANGETLRLGPLAVTAHVTPGHTPGSTTWTWQSCEGERCLEMVYADSLNAVSAPSFRFTDQPGRVDEFRRSIDTVAALPCDVLLSVHPEFSNLDGKLRQRARRVTPDPFMDPGGCRTYAQNARRALERRVQEDRAR